MYNIILGLLLYICVVEVIGQAFVNHFALVIIKNSHPFVPIIKSYEHTLGFQALCCFWHARACH